MDRVLHELGIPDASWQVCYAHRGAKSVHYKYPKELARRKPGGTMIRDLLHHYPEAAAQGAVYVGDRLTDKQTARNAGVHFEYVDSFFPSWAREDA